MLFYSMLECFCPAWASETAPTLSIFQAIWMWIFSQYWHWKIQNTTKLRVGGCGNSPDDERGWQGTCVSRGRGRGAVGMALGAGTVLEASTHRGLRPCCSLGSASKLNVQKMPHNENLTKSLGCLFVEGMGLLSGRIKS